MAASGGDKYAAYVDRQGLVKVFQLEFVQRRDGQHASVIHQDIQASKRLDCSVDRRANRSGIGAVGLYRQGFAAFADHLVLQRLGLGGRTDVGKGNRCALGGEALDDGGADAAGTALNQGDFAGEVVCGHVDLRGS